MVKKLFVSSLQRAKAHHGPASPLILDERFQNQKRELSAKMPRFRGTDRERSLKPQASSLRLSMTVWARADCGRALPSARHMDTLPGWLMARR
jgi:hypothetical protein